MSRRNEQADVINRFLAAFLDDREAGRTHPVEVYQEQFPGFEAVIADEFAKLASQNVPSEGVRIGPYRVVRELGRGGQGTVYLAQDTRLPRRVAVKVMHGMADFAPEDRLRFVREAELASKLDHPNICTVYEAGEAGGLGYLAMRYVEGESLADWIASRRRGAGSAPADRDFALTVVEDLARAVHRAHQLGIVHRDIKPGNVLLDEGGRPVLTDFGTARDLDAQTLTLSGEAIGTPAYMAPEQITGRARQFDWRVDVYALGVTLYECATLSLPFQGASRESLYHKILFTDPPDPRKTAPHFPRDLVAVLECCLEKEPDRRYETALALAEDLARIRRGEPVTVKPSGWVGRMTRRAQRHPIQAALVSSLLTLGIAAAGLMVSRTRIQAAFETESKHVWHLSALPELEDLIREANSLWPPSSDKVELYEDWIRRATALVAGLDSDPGSGRIGHREQLEILRARALPKSEDELQAEMRSHPLYAEFNRLRANIEAKQRAAEVRAGRAEPEEYVLSLDEDLPTTVEGLAMTAFDIVHSDQDNTPRALALARLAEERVTTNEQLVNVLSIKAIILLNLGLIEQAREASELSIELAPEGVRGQYVKRAQDLEENLANIESEVGDSALRVGEQRLRSMLDEIHSDRVWKFESQEDRWLHSVLTQVVRRIEAMAVEGSGLWKGVSPEHSLGVAAAPGVRTRSSRSIDRIRPGSRAMERGHGRNRRSPRVLGIDTRSHRRPAAPRSRPGIGALGVRRPPDG